MKPSLFSYGKAWGLRRISNQHIASHHRHQPCVRRPSSCFHRSDRGDLSCLVFRRRSAIAQLVRAKGNGSFVLYPDSFAADVQLRRPTRRVELLWNRCHECLLFSGPLPHHTERWLDRLVQYQTEPALEMPHDIVLTAAIQAGKINLQQVAS